SGLALRVARRQQLATRRRLLPRGPEMLRPVGASGCDQMLVHKALELGDVAECAVAAGLHDGQKLLESCGQDICHTDAILAHGTEKPVVRGRRPRSWWRTPQGPDRQRLAESGQACPACRWVWCPPRPAVRGRCFSLRARPPGAPGPGPPAAS